MPFKIGIWLDGPYDNETWKGKNIGEISVAPGSAKELTKYTVDVADIKGEQLRRIPANSSLRFFTDFSLGG